MAIYSGTQKVAPSGIQSVYVGTQKVYDKTPAPPVGFTGLCFTAASANSTVALTKVGIPAWSGYYSTDGSTWTTYMPNITGAITLSNIGDKVYFKGDITANFDNGNYLQFVMTGSINASGNINSMYTSTGFESLTTLTYKYCYERLFRGCASLNTAPTLPAIILSEGCYQYMFYGCAALTIAPTLPATTLTNNCYQYMFGGCTSLTTAPQLPATTLAIWCYSMMFYNCTSLTTAPVLPATTLVGSCYYAMFRGCASLTTAPALPATTLATACYWSMFASCTFLTTPPALPATTLTNNCYQYMFYECTSLTKVPALRATTLATNCYSDMFEGCTALIVSDASTSAAAMQWKIPPTGRITGTWTMTGMFSNCAGTRSSDDFVTTLIIGIRTYYTQNTPIY